MSISTIWKMVVAVEVLVAKASWQLLSTTSSWVKKYVWSVVTKDF